MPQGSGQKGCRKLSFRKQHTLVRGFATFAPAALRNYPSRFGLQLVSLFENLKADRKGAASCPVELPSAAATFARASFQDMWDEADMASVCHYLRAGTKLSIPDEFRPFLPTHL